MSKESKKSRNKRTEVQKRNAAARPSITEKNRKAKRQSHSRHQPNDLQTAKLL